MTIRIGISQILDAFLVKSEQMIKLDIASITKRLAYTFKHTLYRVQNTENVIKKRIIVIIIPPLRSHLSRWRGMRRFRR